MTCQPVNFDTPCTTIYFLPLFGTDTEEGEDGYAEDSSQHAVARSYEWLLAVLTHLSGMITTIDICIVYYVLFIVLTLLFAGFE